MVKPLRDAVNRISRCKLTHNVFPAVKARDFLSRRVTFYPERGD